jgi:hypothetical protein
MDYGAMLTDSFEYAKEALMGKWVRWILFIIFGLPFALVKFTFDPEKIMDKATGAFHPELIHWDQLAILIGLGILFGFFLAGYTVRIYRGARPAPEFDNWPRLFVDGLKLNIVWFLWFLPFLVVMTCAFAMIFAVALSGTKASGTLITFLGVMLLLLLISFILAIIAILYSYLGSVRFARTGSIREGIRFREITAMIRQMGWGTYIIALVVMLIAGFAFGIVTMILSVIPYIGWALVVIVTPFATILFGRYATLVYEQAETRPAADLSGPGNDPVTA